MFYVLVFFDPNANSNTPNFMPSKARYFIEHCIFTEQQLCVYLLALTLTRST